MVEKAVPGGEAMVPAVFGKISTGEQAERGADAEPDRGHDERAGDRIQKAAFGRSRRRRVLGEDLPIEPGEAVIEQRKQDQCQPGYPEQRGSEAKPADDEIGAAAAPVNPVPVLSSPG